MIYRIFLKRTKVSLEESHYWGEELLAYGLLKEKGIIYKGECIVKNEWGKKFLKNHPQIHFNISHCENCIVCVIADSISVGIDVEKVRDFNYYAANKVCNIEELERINKKAHSNREFFRYWTLKESTIKAIGKGLTYPMKHACFEIKPDGKIYSNLMENHYVLIEDTKDFIIAVCYQQLRER